MYPFYEGNIIGSFLHKKHLARAENEFPLRPLVRVSSRGRGADARPASIDADYGFRAKLALVLM